MASVSPALHTSRPAGWIDLRKPADYPILLGKSFQAAESSDQLLNLRYNWQPKSGFHGDRTNLKATKDGYRLTIRDSNDSSEPSFVYSGHSRPGRPDGTSHLALVFDKEQSVFRVEVIGTSIDLNLETASLNTLEINRQPKLPRSLAKPAQDAGNVDNVFPFDDETPDPANPFDFRNFLAEARENAEKSAQNGSSRTPLPGSRTPMSGFSSPIPGATRFKATTPQFKPSTKSSPAPKKRRTAEPAKTARLASPMRQKPTQKKRRLAEETREPLSKARISDSDDELSDTIVVAKASTPLQSLSKGHNRNISGGFGRSPHIVVNDGDLEIDLGSPPQEAARGRQRGRIDPGAFRSHTGTPVLGMSSNRRVSVEDVRMMEPEDDRSEDGDVEELELGSPRTNKLSVHGSRSASIVEPPSSSVQEHAPTPPNQAGDDDDDLLAAELEAALEEEDKETDTADRGQGYGLGITGTAQRVDDDDESEVSEEE